MIYDVKLPKLAPSPGILPFCGTNPAGHTLAANGRYLTYDGKPFFPVSGEFHFARYRREDWERELRKMKAGGVNIVATYIFWIHHEEEKGVFDFSGRRDLRAFTELCGKVGLGVILRIGPWCHGECRNGGFPDWIQFQTDFARRTDDPTYLFYVRRWFCEMEKQVHGLPRNRGADRKRVPLVCRAGQRKTQSTYAHAPANGKGMRFSRSALYRHRVGDGNAQ